MLKTKYISQENANKMVAILNKCLELIPELEFYVITDDEGDTIYKGNNPEKAVNEMDGYDCNFGVNCMDNEKFVGWFFFTPYEDIEDVVCDYTDNDFCKESLKCECQDKIKWNHYLKYLLQWANDHSELGCKGMSPACYDEFCDNDDDDYYDEKSFAEIIYELKFNEKANSKHVLDLDNKEI